MPIAGEAMTTGGGGTEWTRRSLLRTGFTVGIAAAGGLRPARAAATGAGVVETVRGEAFVEAAERRFLAPASALFVGDRVGTGMASRLAMKLGAATTVRLGAEARLKIDRFLMEAGGVLDLETGGMQFDRPEGTPKTDVQVRSPFGLIAVRGTHFFCGPSNGAFGVFVRHGAVRVTAGGTSVMLGAGEGTDIAAPGARPSAAAAWSAERVANAFASTG